MLQNLLAEVTAATSQYIMIAVLIGFFVLMFVFSNRSQKKRQRKMADMINALGVGNKIKTIGGIVGVIIEVDNEEDCFIIETGAEGKKCTMKIVKNAVYASDSTATTVANDNQESSSDSDKI